MLSSVMANGEGMAKRTGEATAPEARAVRRLLEIDSAAGGFRRGIEHPLDTDLRVLDEASMIDVSLMHALLRAISEHDELLVVGTDQLPSVNLGQVLAKLIASGMRFRLCA